MKPLKPEEFADIGGAAPLNVNDLPGFDPNPLPLPKPVNPDLDIIEPKFGAER